MDVVGHHADLARKLGTLLVGDRRALLLAQLPQRRLVGAQVQLG